MPDVSIVVVSWRTRDLTLAALGAIDADAARATSSVETILVDNASEDGTVEAVRRDHPRVDVIASDRNVGFAAGCNLGIARARGRYVLLLNPDTEIAPGTIDALVRFLDATPRAGAVGCRLVSPSGEPQFSAGRFLTPFNQFAETLGLARTPSLRRSYSERELSSESVEVDWIIGAAMMLRRTAIDEIGALDERFFMYSEDEDLCYRLRAAGWSVHILPRVRVTHVGGASASQSLRPMRAAARASQSAYMLKHHGAARAAIFRTLMRLAALKPRRDRSHVGWGR